jgi:NAD-dependent dihydropyrimidine dehydrogenase PreA subunit
MKRKIISIDEEECNGCGLCIPECHEGALQVIDGKARLISDLFCDGLGVCIGYCPEGAISIQEREIVSTVEEMNSINVPSELKQWPVQLHLLNPMASYFKGKDVILTADCVAFAMGNFHAHFLKANSLAIACPKLDTNKESYIQKLTVMMNEARINSLKVIIMEVPCCGGLLQMAKIARDNSGRDMPIKVVVVSLQGEITEEENI